MTMLRKTLQAYAARLERAGVDSPRLSAELLLAAAMGLDRNALVKRLILEPESVLDADSLASAETFIARRERGEPAAYITGIKEFYGRDFIVTRATLIPRPDTETLVEAALAFAARHTASSTPSFIDLGAGSGAIAVTLALELPAWRGTAMDISPEALAVAKQNAHRLGADSLRFLRGDFCIDVPSGPFDMIVANPPYVSEAEHTALSPEVAMFEPKNALVPPVPDASGLECLLAIMDVAVPRLRQEGLLLMEMGCSQGEALLERAAESPYWNDCRILRDLAGLPRVFSASRA